jgi:hypothetical protein
MMFKERLVITVAQIGNFNNSTEIAIEIEIRVGLLILLKKSFRKQEVLVYKFIN